MFITLQGRKDFITRKKHLLTKTISEEVKKECKILVLRNIIQNDNEDIIKSEMKKVLSENSYKKILPILESGLKEIEEKLSQMTVIYPSKNSDTIGLDTIVRIAASKTINYDNGQIKTYKPSIEFHQIICENPSIEIGSRLTEINTSFGKELYGKSVGDVLKNSSHSDLYNINKNTTYENTIERIYTLEEFISELSIPDSLKEDDGAKKGDILIYKKNWQNKKYILVIVHIGNKGICLPGGRGLIRFCSNSIYDRMLGLKRGQKFSIGIHDYEILNVFTEKGFIERIDEKPFNPNYSNEVLGEIFYEGKLIGLHYNSGDIQWKENINPKLPKKRILSFLKK